MGGIQLFGVRSVGESRTRGQSGPTIPARLSEGSLDQGNSKGICSVRSLHSCQWGNERMRTTYFRQLIVLTSLLVFPGGVLGQQGVHSAQSQSCVLQGTVSVSTGSGERLPGASLTLTPAG